MIDRIENPVIAFFPIEKKLIFLFGFPILMVKQKRRYLFMDYRRAKEIVSSPDMADVTYENKPVYMEMVNTDQTCTVHYLNQPNEKMSVPVSSLVER